jgi:hypothetical protein
VAFWSPGRKSWLSRSERRRLIIVTCSGDFRCGECQERQTRFVRAKCRASKRFSVLTLWGFFHNSCVGPTYVLAGRFGSGMHESNVASKDDRHFSKVPGIWTKLCWAKGTFIVARKSSLAVRGCDEVCFFPHAESLCRTLVHRYPYRGASSAAAGETKSLTFDKQRGGGPASKAGIFRCSLFSPC